MKLSSYLKAATKFLLKEAAADSHEFFLSLIFIHCYYKKNEAGLNINDTADSCITNILWYSDVVRFPGPLYADLADDDV